jgi:hypothetical protein
VLDVMEGLAPTESNCLGTEPYMLTSRVGCAFCLHHYHGVMLLSGYNISRAKFFRLA